MEPAGKSLCCLSDFNRILAKAVRSLYAFLRALSQALLSPLFGRFWSLRDSRHGARRVSGEMHAALMAWKSCQAQVLNDGGLPWLKVPLLDLESLQKFIFGRRCTIFKRDEGP